MKFITKLLVGITLTCAVVDLNAQEKGIVLDKIIAVVGDEIITKSELESNYAGLVAKGMKVSDNSRCEVLEDILFSKLLLNQAKVDSVEVTDGQVEAEMDRRLRYIIGQIGSEEKMVEYYQKPLSKIKDEMRESMREQLLIQAMQGQITADVSITPDEVRKFYEEFPKDSLPLINAAVEVAQLVIEAKTSQKSIDEVREKLNEYRTRVNEGEKFSTLAVLYSEDEGSAVKGGEIGFVGKAEVEPEFSAASFRLKSGQVSPIIKTRYGYHIIQLIERRANKVNVRHILLKPKLDDRSLAKAKQEIDSIGNLITNDSLSFEEAARKLSDDEETKQSGGLIVNPYTASTMTEMDQLDPSLFFVIDKMEVGDVSEAVKISDPRKQAGYRIIKLKGRTEPHRASLDTDYQAIKGAALAEKEQKVLQEWMHSSAAGTYVHIDEEYTEGCTFMQEWNENIKD